jgi:hypothetical protein
LAFLTKEKFMKRWVLSLLIIFSFSAVSAGEQPARPQAINKPTLKWQYGGCTSWCQTGWYSSPAVADLDNNGSLEVIAGSYSLFILNGSNGTLKQSAIAPPASGARIWPDIVLADLENDGDLEIVAAYGAGYVRVFNHNGVLVWSRQPTPGNELRSLGVYDLDHDGDLEIMVASTVNNNQWWVYEHNGDLRAGSWPQHSPDSDVNGYTAGAYNQNLAAADLTGDGLAEIIGPNDTHYIAAFHADGSQVRANAIYGRNPDSSNKYWSRVGVHVQHSVDLVGYANCGVQHRPNFAHSAPVINDLDNNGTLEIITVGNVYNCGTDPYTDLYEMPFIFNADRTRWSSGGYDWSAIPTPDQDAAPLSEDWEEIQNSHPNPVIADLDNDGNKEILYSSYDGRLHAYWLDKTEHGDFPYRVYSPQSGRITFSSEPAVADLDNDGQAEIIFTTWVENEVNGTGSLIMLNSRGQLLQSVSLPQALDSNSWNGGLAAPTLANIDGDADLEVIVNTAASGVVAYDLPGTANARVLWGTGRGNYWRSGSPVYSKLDLSYLHASNVAPIPAETVTFTIHLIKEGILPDFGELDLQIPSGLTYADGLIASSGTAGYSAGNIHWEGALVENEAVEIQFNALVGSSISGPTAISTTAILQGKTSSVELSTVLFVNGKTVFLPVVQKR